ncbi:MAG TPA: electron transfer flavoprotein subunit alpha/FixB family protein, partial [Polyangiaceae bacterium]|nr:electron transfer flavoprotein subunit alpha/FixB family protein [Polyangiaceae bacterium]
ELSESGVRKSTHSAISCARRINQLTGGSFSILVAGGPGAKAAAAELSSFGAARVLCTEDPSLQHYLAERYAPIVAAAAKGFDVVVATASTFGKDLLPRVAARLDAAYAPDCSDVLEKGGKLVYKRPMYAGNAYGLCVLESAQQVVGVRQSEFEPAEPSGGASPVSALPLAAPGAAAQRVQFVSLDQVKSERPELAEARVIVSGGRALKDQFFQVIEPLANALGAAIGASRAACDAGYAPGDFQVGQTGKVVAPELYIAIGISGAIQHIAGMKGSKTIVAINKDPEAPIFQIADYGLVADLFQAVPELVTALAARKK